MPIDWSDNSANGLKYAIELTKDANIELDLLHVESDGKNEMPHSALFQKELVNHGNFKEILRKGNIASEILQLAQELEPAMIIMNPDVFNKGKKFFEESETGRVMKHSHFPILIIPPDAEFTPVNRILFVSDMNENIIESIRQLLLIFGNQKPHIEIVILQDRIKEWHFKEDLKTLISNIKQFLNYENISSEIAEQRDKELNLVLFSGSSRTDLISMEYNVESFHRIFFHSDPGKLSHLKHMPFLILPRYWK